MKENKKKFEVGDTVYVTSRGLIEYKNSLVFKTKIKKVWGFSDVYSLENGGFWTEQYLFDNLTDAVNCGTMIANRIIEEEKERSKLKIKRIVNTVRSGRKKLIK